MLVGRSSGLKLRVYNDNGACSLDDASVGYLVCKGYMKWVVCAREGLKHSGGGRRVWKEGDECDGYGEVKGEGGGPRLHEESRCGCQG